MTIDSTRVVLHLNRGPLLAGVVRAAVEFQASHAGLDTGSCGKFAKACEDVCHETLSHLTEDDGGLEVTLDTFADRIEISIHHHGQLGPAMGLETFTSPEALAGRAGGLNGMEILAQVDRVLFNTEDGAARTTLVKLLTPKR